MGTILKKAKMNCVQARDLDDCGPWLQGAIFLRFLGAGFNLVIDNESRAAWGESNLRCCSAYDC